jgi:hypothetical protein
MALRHQFIGRESLNCCTRHCETLETHFSPSQRSFVLQPWNLKPQTSSSLVISCNVPVPFPSENGRHQMPKHRGLPDPFRLPLCAQDCIIARGDMPSCCGASNTHALMVVCTPCIVFTMFHNATVGVSPIFFSGAGRTRLHSMCRKASNSARGCHQGCIQWCTPCCN